MQTQSQLNTDTNSTCDNDTQRQSAYTPTIQAHKQDTNPAYLTAPLRHQDGTLPADLKILLEAWEHIPEAVKAGWQPLKPCARSLKDFLATDCQSNLSVA